jgi:hypothetical protein
VPQLRHSTYSWNGGPTLIIKQYHLNEDGITNLDITEDAVILGVQLHCEKPFIFVGVNPTTDNPLAQAPAGMQRMVLTVKDMIANSFYSKYIGSFWLPADSTATHVFEVS